MDQRLNIVCALMFVAAICLLIAALRCDKKTGDVAVDSAIAASNRAIIRYFVLMSVIVFSMLIYVNVAN